MLRELLAGWLLGVSTTLLVVVILLTIFDATGCLRGSAADEAPATSASTSSVSEGLHRH